MQRYTTWIVVTVLALFAQNMLADVAVLTPSKDASIYEPDDNQANGAGSLFSGRTGAPANFVSRRAMMAFNIASAIPAGATITSATLTLTVIQKSKDSLGADTYLMHALSNNWTEGPTVGGGTGGASVAGDTTWVSNVYGTSEWTNAGGDFDSIASGSIGLNAPATYTSLSSAGLVSDVQQWLDSPATNFGWILIADGEIANSARIISSREDLTAANRPKLTVTYTPVPEPGIAMSVAFLGAALLGRRR